jgi:hypothetical protein
MNGTVRHPLSNAIEVVEQVVQCCEDLDAVNR